MKKILAVLDSDAYFCEMLAAYVRASEFAERYTVRSFNSNDVCSRFIEQERDDFILLTHESFLPLVDAALYLRSGTLVVLGEQEVNTSIREYPMMFKYQPLDRLLTAITAHHNEFRSGEPIAGAKETSIVSLYSAVAGAGKSITAANLARKLTQEGERVILLPLEQLPSAAWYPVQHKAEVDDPFSELLYVAREHPDQLVAKLEQTKQKHPAGRYDYIPAAMTWGEMTEMCAQDVERLLDALLASRCYDRIVLDLDSSLHATVRAALLRSDTWIWLLRDNAIQLSKASIVWRRLKDELQLPSNVNIQFALNEDRGKQLCDLGVYGFKIHGLLPYVAEWRSHMGEELPFSPVFANRARALLDKSGPRTLEVTYAYSGA